MSNTPNTQAPLPSIVTRSKRLISLSIVTAVVLAIGTAIWIVSRRATNVTERPTVSVAAATWMGFGMASVGDSTGCSTRITMSVLDDTTQRRAAFISGNADILVSSLDAFSQELAQGIRGRILLITDESAGGDGLLVRSTIQRIEDLRGKRVAIARGTPSHLLVFKALQRAGMTFSDINVVYVDSPTDAGRVFASGQVEAAATWEPDLSQVAQQTGGRVLLTSRDIPGAITDILVVSERLERDPARLRGFLDCWYQGLEVARTRPADGRRALAAVFHVPEADVSGGLAGLRLVPREESRARLCGSNGSNIRAAYEDVRSFWQSVGVQAAQPPAQLVSAIACE